MLLACVRLPSVWAMRARSGMLSATWNTRSAVLEGGREPLTGTCFCASAFASACRRSENMCT